MENFGLKMERVAVQYLETVKGWRLIDQRVRFREGEIDLIMVSNGALRFVEVKGRRSVRFGGVVESVTAEKLRRLRRAVFRWRMKTKDCRPGLLYFVGVFVNELGALTIEEHILE